MHENDLLRKLMGITPQHSTLDLNPKKLNDSNLSSLSFDLSGVELDILGYNLPQTYGSKNQKQTIDLSEVDPLAQIGRQK